MTETRIRNYNSCGIAIPYEFAKSRMPLNASDIHFGIEQNVFKKVTAYDYALDHLAAKKQEQDNLLLSLLLDIQTLSKKEICDVLKRIAAIEHSETKTGKFFDLFMFWIFQYKGADDFWERVEIIYDDFDAPKDAAGFIPYMPFQKEPGFDQSGPSEKYMMCSLECYIGKRKKYWKSQMQEVCQESTRSYEQLSM